MVNPTRRPSSSSATPVTASGKRALRYATAYAAHDGERPLKKRALESFAPAAKLLTLSSPSSTTSLRGKSHEGKRGQEAAQKMTTVELVATGTPAAVTAAEVSSSTSVSGATAPPPLLLPSTLQFLRDHCPNAPRSVPSEAVRLVRSVTAVADLEAGGAVATTTTTTTTVLRRLFLKGSSLSQIADGLALASLEHSFASRGQSVVVVVVEPIAATVEALRLRIATTFAIPTIVVDDTCKAPCTLHVPLTPEQDLNKRAAPIVIATSAGLGRLAKASNVWECCGAVVVLTSAALEEVAVLSNASSGVGGGVGTAVTTTTTAAKDYACPLTAQFRALRNLVLLSNSVEMLSKPCWRKWLLGSASSSIITEADAQQSRDTSRVVGDGAAATTTQKKKKAGQSKSVEQSTAAGTITTTSSSTAVVNHPAARPDGPLLVAHYITVEGLPRFQAVYGLITGHAARCSRANEGAAAASHVVVALHFATAESAAFWFDVLLALQELPEGSTTILCDSDLVKERPAPLGGGIVHSHPAAPGDEVKQLSEVHTKLNTEVNKALSAIAAGKRQGSCVVVLSCSAYVPSFDALQGSAQHHQQTAAAAAATKSNAAQYTVDVVLVQYDAMLSISSFSAFLAKAQRHCCSGGSGGLRNAAALQVAVRLHPLVLLRRNEAPAALPILQASGEAHGVQFVAQARPPSATVAYLSAQKFMSLHKKMFAVQLKAFEAYRATMQVYSRLRPTEVYRVSTSIGSGDSDATLNLDLVGAEFGYTEIPLLDLRTKSTPFRPREDVAKAAKQRLVREQRAKRKYADEHLVGEGPDEDPFYEKTAQ